MKRFTTITVMALAMITASGVKASDQVPYIAMPTGLGNAVDVKGGRHAAVESMRDAVFAPKLPAAWVDHGRGPGMYRLQIDQQTGRVANVIVLNSMGYERTDAAIIGAFKLWRFRPNIWRQIDVPTVVKMRWVAVSEPMGYF